MLQVVQKPQEPQQAREVRMQENAKVSMSRLRTQGLPEDSYPAARTLSSQRRRYITLSLSAE